MSAMANQITGVLIVCFIVCSGADQRKHHNSASLAFVRRIHWSGTRTITTTKQSTNRPCENSCGIISIKYMLATIAVSTNTVQILSICYHSIRSQAFSISAEAVWDKIVPFHNYPRLPVPAKYIILSKTYDVFVVSPRLNCRHPTAFGSEVTLEQSSWRPFSVKKINFCGQNNYLWRELLGETTLPRNDKWAGRLSFTGKSIEASARILLDYNGGKHRPLWDRYYIYITYLHVM